METVDLSHLFGDSPERQFEREITLGKEKGRLLVSFKTGHLLVSVEEGRLVFSSNERPWGVNGFSILVSYDGLQHREFQRNYGLKAVPAKLTRKLVLLGASKTFMRRLQAAYDEILAAVRPISHDKLHTDTSDSEYDD